MSELRDKIAEAQADIIRMYQDAGDTRDWAVAWSGGKDSTVVLALTLSAIETLPKESLTRHIHVSMSDTAVENPQLEDYMHSQLRLLRKHIEAAGLPVSVSLVRREQRKSYFYLLLGRGYYLPLNNGRGRWCTDRLKLEPRMSHLKSINPSYVLTGVRLDESSLRRASIEKFTEDPQLNIKIARDGTLTSSKNFMPIVNFTVEDVWGYLSSEGVPWGSTSDIRRLYKEATGECGFTNPLGVQKKSVESCGARFGCWVCPVVVNDRSTEKMSETHKWMEPLTEWRVLQLKVFGTYVPIKPDGQSRKERSAELSKWREQNRRTKLISKSGYSRKGKRMEDGQGTLTVEAREFLLEQLLETERIMNFIRKGKGLPPLTLISQEEVEMIRSMHKEDRQNCPYLVTNQLGISASELYELI